MPKPAHGLGEASACERNWPLIVRTWQLDNAELRSHLILESHMCRDSLAINFEFFRPLERL